jgi:glycosyltransferase involved in cell wall biosynthesis
VIYDRFLIEEQFGWRVEENSPNTIRILDTIDIHFLRRSRERLLKAGAELHQIANCQLDQLISEDTYRELSSIYRSDSVLLVSDYEMELLTHQFNISPERLFLNRFHYPEMKETPSFEERENFIFIGNFRHAPNLDAVHWLRKVIWPLIKKELPGAQVHIYGAYPSREAMSLTQKSLDFYVKGPAENQFETLQKYRVNLAPLRFGAGIKGKVSDGWWCGTPVVTTEIGAEGMTENLSFGGEVSNDPIDFCKKAVTLYQDRSIWKNHQSFGKKIIRELYSKEQNSQEIIQHLISIHGRISEMRRSNIIGSMLQYNLCRSTKYFSKWIEEKTKGANQSSLPSLLSS